MDNKRIHVSYTAGAEKELKAFTEDLKKRIEDSLIKGKYVTGDSEIEITASDIERIKNRITIQSDLKRERNFLLLGYMYIIIGIISFLISLFWNDIEDMISNGQINAIFGLGGIGISLFGILLVFIISAKTKRSINNAEDLKKIDLKYNEIYNIKQYEKITELYNYFLQKELEEKELKEEKNAKEAIKL